MSKERFANLGNEKLFKRKQIVELEKKPSIGTILAIVGIDPSKNGKNIDNPLLWTTTEKESKEITNKFEGQISFPADTRKIGEDIMRNTIGSLAEFSDNERLIREALSLMPSSFIEKAISVKGNLVDLVVVIFDESLTYPIVPLDLNEVGPNGWMSVDRLKKENPSHLRSFVKEIISMEDEVDSPIKRVIADYFEFKQTRIPLSSILPSGFSMIDFYNKRERLPDVVK